MGATAECARAYAPHAPLPDLMGEAAIKDARCPLVRHTFASGGPSMEMRVVGECSCMSYAENYRPRFHFFLYSSSIIFDPPPPSLPLLSLSRFLWARVVSQQRNLPEEGIYLEAKCTGSACCAVHLCRNTPHGTASPRFSLVRTLARVTSR